jgi:hypothetical protein
MCFMWSKNLIFVYYLEEIQPHGSEGSQSRHRVENCDESRGTRNQDHCADETQHKFSSQSVKSGQLVKSVSQVSF